MTLSAGQQLQYGRYTIRQHLGQGGMGTVYLATDRNLGGRFVAIKENLDPSPDAQIQFQITAEMLATLSHANLPRATDHFVENNGFQYLVMDYIAGEDLSQLLRKNGSLPEDQVLRWIDQVLDALEYMHSWVDPETETTAPILHRDIKPGNIRITPRGQAVLVDFGLAKRSDGESTFLGARGVTPGYSPVEQYTGGTDVRSDIYAVGATLYTLLTGRKPPNATELAANATLLPPRRLNPQIRAGTERAILRAMSTQAVDRYQDATALRAALQAKGVFTTAPHFGFGTQGKQTPRRWVESVLTAGIVIVALLLIGNLVLSYQERPTATTEPGDADSAAVAAVLPTATTPATATIERQATTAATTAATATTRSTPSPSTPRTIARADAMTPTATAILPATATATAVPPTPTVTNTATPPPTATATFTAQPTPSPTASVTMTATPTATGTATRSPTATPALSPPTATAVPQPSFNDAAVTLLEPNDGDTLNNRRRFVWQPNFTLPTGYYFEPVFWRAGASAMGDSAGYGGSTTANSMELQPDQFFQGPGDYYWGVLLVKIEPTYVRIKYLGGNRRLRVETTNSSKDSSADGSGTRP